MKKIIFVLLILTVLFSFSVAYANNSELKDIDKKVEEQNKKILEELNKHKNSEDNTMDKLYEMIEEQDKEEIKDISLPTIKSNIENLLIELSLKLRRLIIPITAIVVILNTFMLSTLGSKNLKRRKKYIFGSISFFIFFLVVINLPIYIIWRSSVDVNIFTFEWLFNLTIGIVNFFRDHSLMFSIIILTYGIFNYIISDNNLPRRMASLYFMKMAVFMFVIFQSLPWILKLAF